ncbi:PilW family protein [Spectribacter hydrogenooxidans]|uniref:PilW family protein n=1 Tax=Spectribacter hydrogenoxidans TaxID=3075608 RepID=A0ABU3C1G5_9GAMM|nr:PilW family protein [Salinisphaera sp. W335]MDT0635402.1 PilW family protein [Salinisphaera sp. W335]
MSSWQRQAGFTLTELMIGMVIGLLLLAGILEILLGNRESFRVQQEQAALQQNARVVSYFLDTIVAHAGYYPDAFLDAERIFRNGGDPLRGEDGRFDEVTIRFRSDGAMNDCAGGLVAEDVISTNRFYVSDTDNDGNATLLCQRSLRQADGSAVTRPDGSTVGDSFLPLIENVSALSIRYGMDTNEDGSVDRYGDATAVAAVSDFDHVHSVHMQVVLASEGDVLTTARDAGDDQQFDETLFDDNLALPTDRRQRVLVDRVIALKNRLP